MLNTLKQSPTYRNMTGICVALFLFLSLKINARPGLSLILGGGPMYYMGELQSFSVPNLKLVHPSVAAGIAFRPIAFINLSLEYTRGSVSGADSISVQSFSQRRNLHFKSTIDAINFYASMNLFNFRRKFACSPYLIGGIGIFHFNPKAQFKNSWTELQPLGTEGQFISSGNYPSPYKLSQLNLPMGFGISYRITKTIEVNLDAVYHKTFTDYLDDVSGYYPNMSQLADGPNGETAVLLSNRSNETVDETNLRGNPTAMDGFVHFNLAIAIQLTSFHQKKSTKQKYNTIIKQGDCKKLQKRLKI